MAFPDDYAAGRKGPLDAPITRAAAVTPDDGTDITDGQDPPNYPRCLWVGTAGDLTVDLAEGGTDVVYKNVSGTFPRRVKRVKVASTAADIVAEW